MTYLMVKTGMKTIIFSFKRKGIRFYLIKLFYKLKKQKIEVFSE